MRPTLIALLLLTGPAPEHPPIRDPATVTETADRISPPAPTTTTPPRITGTGPDTARAAILSQGGTRSEADFAATVCPRESNCTLDVWNYNRATRDDSWGPFQINYYGNLRAERVRLIGPPESNVESWERAAANFLTFLRLWGRCHWQAPNYCAGR